MPKIRRVFIESSDEEATQLINQRKSTKSKKKKQPQKKKPRITYDSSDSGSDLSFVVSDSDDASSDDEQQVQKPSKFYSKSDELKSILGAKSEKISVSQFQGRLTKNLFKFFNEKIFNGKLSPRMPISWNSRLVSAAGRCMYEPKLSIELSPKIIQTDKAKLRDILLHEMVHAMAFTTKKEYGHGTEFYRIADRIERELPKIPRVERCHNFKIDYKYTFYCVECGEKYERQRRTIDLKLDRCSTCCGRLKVRQNF